MHSTIHDDVIPLFHHNIYEEMSDSDMEWVSYARVSSVYIYPCGALVFQETNIWCI